MLLVHICMSTKLVTKHSREVNGGCVSEALRQKEIGYLLSVTWYIKDIDFWILLCLAVPEVLHTHIGFLKI